MQNALYLTTIELLISLLMIFRRKEVDLGMPCFNTLWTSHDNHFPAPCTLSSPSIIILFLSSFGLIGSRGSIGNFISKHPDSIPIYRNNQNHLKILSKDEMIIAAVPFRSIQDVLKTIPSERQKDLVFLCNGMVNLDQVSTCAALYFGVKEDGSLITSKTFPTLSACGLLN